MDYKQLLKQEILRRQSNRNNQDSKMEALLQQNEKLVDLDPSARTDLTPMASFVDQMTGSNLARTVKAPESSQDALRKALQARMQAPKQDMMSPLKTAMADEQAKDALRAKLSSGGKEPSIEKLKRLGSARVALGALQDVESALSKGSSVLPEFLTGPSGDNEFSEAARNFVEGFGRMQSGGAITSDEDKRFARLLPRFQDDPEIRERKLKRLKDEVRLRIEELGGDVPNNYTGQTQQNPDSIDFSQLSDEQLKKIAGQ